MDPTEAAGADVVGNSDDDDSVANDDIGYNDSVTDEGGVRDGTTTRRWSL